jgi:sulfofructose kinase
LKTVACVGITVRDIIFSVESLPSGPGKTHASDRHEVGGGPAANAAVAIAKLGGQARFIGPIGNDALGSELIDELMRLGVDTSRARTVPNQKSPLSAVVVDGSGERSIVNHTGPGLFDEAVLVEATDLEGVDAVLADVRWFDGAVAALEWARSTGIPGIVDFDIGARDSQPLLDGASHVVFSADAIRSLSGHSELGRCLEEVSKQTDAWLAVTDGPNGTFWLDEGQVRHADAFEVDVVDTTGAGDIYHGAFALALAEGKTETEAIELSSAAAAISCERFGGRTGIPDRDELEAFLEERQ